LREDFSSGRLAASPEAAFSFCSGGFGGRRRHKNALMRHHCVALPLLLWLELPALLAGMRGTTGTVE
jgi:hypothetical protein